MTLITEIFIFLVAVECFYIMYIETFASVQIQSRIFNIPTRELENENIRTLFKNQGIYNGLLGLSLIYALFISSHTKEISILLLVFIILAAVYGAFTVNKSILVKQGLLPALALIFAIIAL